MSNRLNEENVTLTNPAINKLEVTTNSPDKKYYRNNWLRMEPFENLEEDTALIKNIRVHIIKSPTDSFRVTMIRMACGPDKTAANRLANLIEYKTVQMDSLLVIDKGININRTDKFRNQRIILTIYVPVGKQIKINRNVGWGNEMHFGAWGDDRYLESDDTEDGWDEGIEYKMTANEGLVDINGKPANEWKYPRAKKTNDDDGEMMNSDDGDGYRYDKSIPATKIDSLRMKLNLEKRNLRDSLQKEKDSINKKKQIIEKQLEKIGGNGDQTSIISYGLPAYNPMLILN